MYTVVEQIPFVTNGACGVVIQILSIWTSDRNIAFRERGDTNLAPHIRSQFEKMAPISPVGSVCLLGCRTLDSKPDFPAVGL